MTAIPSPLDPYINDIRGFVRFSPDGRIRGCGQMAYGFIYDEMVGNPTLGSNPPGPNPYIMLGNTLYDRDIGEYPDWVNEQGQIAPRPVLERTFDTLTPAPNVEACMEDLPEATVSFTGPVSDSFEHPGGLLEIGWTVPGTYVVTIKAWPHMPATFTFEVKKP